jgi:hypothetical protein
VYALKISPSEPCSVLAMSGIKRQALQAARSHSLNFRPDALEAAVEFTKQHHATGREPSDILLSLLSESKPLLSSSQVSIDVVQTAMQNLSEKWSATGSHITAFESINVFSVPKYQHDFATSNFVPYRPEKTTFQGTPQTVDGKTALMRARFELLKQRLLRDPKFDMRGDVAGESMAMEANDNVIAVNCATHQHTCIPLCIVAPKLNCAVRSHRWERC